LARQVVAEYADLRIGLADASTVVLARRLRVRDVLTLDERHFRLFRGHAGRPLRVIPADLI
jgi:predicted nucleic acid-binding protein